MLANVETAATLGIPLLTLLVVLPLVGAVMVSLMNKAQAEQIKLVALVFSLVTGALSVYMLAKFPSGQAGFQFVSQQSWVSEWGISWHLGVDGISLFLVVLTGVLFPLVIIGIDPHHDQKP